MAITAETIAPAAIQYWGMAVKLILILASAFVVYLLIWYINKTKRYSYRVVIYTKDAVGNLIQKKEDRAGIFLDKKTAYRLFKLKKNKFALDPDDIPYIMTEKGTKIVYLLQTGLMNYQYLKPQVSANPGLVFNVQDEDVAWAINAYERNKKIFQNNFLQQILPFIGMAFVFLTIVVALYFVFVKAGYNADTLEAIQAAQRAISENLRAAASGTAVIGG